MSEVRERYKMTELGEIPSEWEVVPFKSCCSIVSGLVDPNEEKYKEYPHIGNANIEKESGKLLEFNLVKDENLISGKFLFNEKHVLYGKINPHFAKATYPRFKGLCSADMYPIETTPEILTPEYLLYSILDKRFTKAMTANSARTGIPKVNKQEMDSYKFILPTIIEQQKIASILSTVDEQIDETELLIVKTRELKKGLMQQLLTKGIGHTEFKQTELGEIPVEWEVKAIGDLFEIRKETTSNVIENALYSLTIENGLIEKPEQYERSFLLKNKAENKYSLVYPNDIVINPMNLRFGAIGKANIAKPVAVSAYYDVIYVKDEVALSEFYIELYKSPQMIMKYDSVSTGSLLEKKRVHLSQFVKLKVIYPPLEEQHKIAQILSTVDEQIEVYEQEKARYEVLKKGLMQQLLTGQIRVKI